jgi:hypothetical protein
MGVAGRTGKKAIRLPYLRGKRSSRSKISLLSYCDHKSSQPKEPTAFAGSSRHDLGEARWTYGGNNLPALGAVACTVPLHRMVKARFSELPRPPAGSPHPIGPSSHNKRVTVREYDSCAAFRDYSAACGTFDPMGWPSDLSSARKTGKSRSKAKRKNTNPPSR